MPAAGKLLLMAKPRRIQRTRNSSHPNSTRALPSVSHSFRPVCVNQADCLGMRTCTETDTRIDHGNRRLRGDTPYQ